MQHYNSRDEVPEEFKWDLSSYFKNDQEFENSLIKTTELAKELKNYVGCTKDANLIYEFLKKEIDVIARWEDLYVYAFLINDQELGVSESIIRKNKALQLNKLIVNNISFFENELLKLSKDDYESLFKKCIELDEFRMDLDRIYRKKEHLLKENEEIIVNELVSTLDHFEEMSSNLINNEHDYGKVKLDNGDIVEIATTNFRYLMRNKDEKIRKKVYNQFNKIIYQYSGSNAAYLNGYISMNNTLDKIYHFKDSWQHRLFELSLNDKVFKTLVKTTFDNLNVIHRFYELKRDILGVSKLHRYDLYLELANLEKEYSIIDAQKLIRESLKPLGNDYLSKYDKVIKNRYIDYCQYKGKCSGGYSASSLRQDSRILLSYDYTLDAVSTIAHEVGHNINYQYINENNSLQYRNPDPIVAEVASLVNECLLTSYLVNYGESKEERLAGLARIIDIIANNLFDAVREGKIEEELYEEVYKDGVLTKDFLDKKVISSLKKFYGSAVKMDKYAANNWVTVSHYYMHFYLYSYAICISVATNVAKEILNGNQIMLDNYKKFLCLGSDKWPSEAFLVLGINLEDSNVYEKAINYLDELIDKYYEIYNEKEVK